MAGGPKLWSHELDKSMLHHQEQKVPLGPIYPQALTGPQDVMVHPQG